MSDADKEKYARITELTEGRNLKVKEEYVSVYLRDGPPTPTQLLEAEQSSSKIRRRYKARMWDDIAQIAKKRGHTEEFAFSQCEMLDVFLDDFTPDLDQMRIEDWAELVVDADPLGQRIALVKTHFPSLDILLLWKNRPRTFLEPEAQLTKSILQVKSLLSGAKNIDSILTVLPACINIEYTVSILVTMKRWFPGENVVLELENDPEMILRAAAAGMPLDPVFFDGETWMAPSLDASSTNNNLEWQQNLRIKQKAEEEAFWELQRRRKFVKEGKQQGSLMDALLDTLPDPPRQDSDPVQTTPT